MMGHERIHRIENGNALLRLMCTGYWQDLPDVHDLC